MLPRNESSRTNRWYSLIIVLTGLALISSCVSSTLDVTVSDAVSASHAYHEIKAIAKKLSEGGDPADYEALVENHRLSSKRTQNTGRWTRYIIFSAPS